MKIAAITMVYNEPVFLPLWANYYGEQLGPDALFVVDHGSDDGTINRLPNVNRVRLPRSALDNAKRTAFVSEFATSLLRYYDTVIYTDVDEFIVPDPRKFDGLSHFCEVRKNSVVTAIGLNVVQKCSVEGSFNYSFPVLKQRRFVRLCSPMSKPCVTSVPIQWTPGFHGCKTPALFEDLYLFHLRYFDLDYGLQRLNKTRNQAWSSQTAGAHQRVEDQTWKNWFRQYETFESLGGLFSDTGTHEVLSFIERFKLGERVNSAGFYEYGRDLPNKVLEIPAEFRDIF